MEIVVAAATNLFGGSESEPRQLVRVVLRGSGAVTQEPARVTVEGDRLRSDGPVIVGSLEAGAEARIEIPVEVDSPTFGETLPATVVVEDGSSQPTRHSFDFEVAEPGWRMFMISHFHYDPVWWNTQAAYTETWGRRLQYRSPFQEPGLALVKAHLEMARRDPDYKFVLAELDYLKPYWDAYPEDRDYMRQLLADGRLEFMGGTYNEPNTNLTSAESTIRNAIYGVGYQRDVLGGAPATAWQLDAFGHDPQFPGIMADAGITSSSWARGPFHEWGPRWVRGSMRMPIPDLAAGKTPTMQFPTEFDWIAPSGRALLTSFMANHYSSGWWMDASATLEAAEEEVYRLFQELAAVATTRNVLLPVGTDYSPPNKWLTAIYRDWSSRYVWPKFVPAIPREFFDAVRRDQASTGRGFSPQTRDMNPVYTGKDVSFVDTKQAQRIAENTLLDGEKFATIASLLGARFPTEAVDKAWRQLLFGAHHDGITGSESDQVYLDLLGGWREALELGRATLDGALDHVAGQIDTSGDGLAVTIFNALSWARTDVARATLDWPAGSDTGIELRDDAGAAVPFVLEAARRRDDGSLERARLAFIARDVPALGYRTYRAVAVTGAGGDAGWHPVDGTAIENEAFAVRVDPERGGAVVSLVEKGTGKELIQRGRAGNELLAYREYPNHPHFAEGPWHLTPDGRSTSSVAYPATVTTEESPIGRRIRIEGPFERSRRTQEIVLWDGIGRVDCSTRLDDYSGQDTLFRIHYPIALEGGRPVSEVGNAVVGRGFGFPNVDVAQVPFTLDNPAYNWFGLGSTARVALLDSQGKDVRERASRAVGIADVVVPGAPAQDEAVRRLAVALVRTGVTSTVSRHDGDRYGVLHIDSNLPDFRVAIGSPAENQFAASVIEAAGDRYRAELDRQLDGQGWARVWIPQEDRAPDSAEAFPDLRGPLDLPVLIVAGRDEAATTEAIEALVEDLDDAVITVQQPAELDGDTGRAENFSVAVLNRGVPSFNIEEGGGLYLSLMRSCSGWPSGVWIDPPRRAAPDGSNFQFQHWTHTFEYAIAAGAGDWRRGQIVRAGHDYNHPLEVRVGQPHGGTLPATTSLFEVQPASVVVTALKPSGNPLARMASPEVDPGEGLVVRLYESSERPTEASIRSTWPIESLQATNLLGEGGRPVDGSGSAIKVRLEPFEIVTLRASLAQAPTATGGRSRLAPGSDIAQPVFSDYWMHNKGAAPMGYQPLSVGIRPWLLSGSGPFTLPVSVASERTDVPVAGSVVLEAPPGWQVSPGERLFRLAPGAHLAFEASVSPAPGAAPGRYFVAARVADQGQVYEDVVTIDYRMPRDGDERRLDANTRSPALARSVDRALHLADMRAERTRFGQAGVHEPGGELKAELLDGEVKLTAGARGRLRVSIANNASSEIRGEAQLLSPHETWPLITPWTQGFAVGPAAATVLTFDVSPPPEFLGGTYWALVKIMYFGRLLYTASIPVAIAPAEAAVALSAAARR